MIEKIIYNSKSDSRLDQFLKFREDVVIKKTKFDLKKAEDRAHILIGLSISVENIDKIIKIIRSSKTPDEAKKLLLKSKFKSSDNSLLINIFLGLNAFSGYVLV